MVLSLVGLAITSYAVSCMYTVNEGYLALGIGIFLLGAFRMICKGIG